tara:strand:- start:351 stop:881 length:531 start_codon:yes stop_codon:yes gene_type:complete
MKKILAVVVLGLFVSGCATKVVTVQATSQFTKDVLNFKIPNNKSRIYFLAGSCDVPLRKMTCAGAGGIFLNKKYIGGLYKKDVMAADIKPGNYEITWNYNPTYKEKAFGQKNIPLKVNLNSGEFIIVRLSIQQGPNVTAGVLLGVGANPDEYIVTITKDKSLLMNKNVIVPITILP